MTPSASPTGAAPLVGLRGGDAAQAGAVSRSEMPPLPERGDRPAWKWLWAGVGFYVVFGAAFVFSILFAGGDAAGSPVETPGDRLFQLVGWGDRLNVAVFLLVLGSMALTVWAAVSVRNDIRKIAAEEEDIDWLLRKKREGILLVFAPASSREALFAQGIRSAPPDGQTTVDTLVDDRVRRVHAARLESGSAGAAPDELRSIAVQRTARLGSFARYASSLLLLFAVLGTFAGVKTALPSLITAVSAGGNMQDSIAAPLRAVADAFGGNALALVGAVAVGLMAQGIGLGRQNLLERLETVSAEYIFDNRRSGSADPLRAAVEALNETAQEIRSSSGAFLGIEGGLQALGTRFEAAFVSLDERLSDLVQQQREGLYDRTGQALEELYHRVSRLAEAVDANARVYAGLVDLVGERTAESRAAVQQMQEASGMLTRALDGIIRLGDASQRSADTAESATRLLADATQQVWQQTEALARAMEGARPAFEEVKETIGAMSERLATVDERASRSWTEAGQEIARTLAGMTAGGSAPVAPVAGAPEVAALLRRIAAGVEAQQARPLSPVLLAALPLLGALLGGGLVYTLLRLL